MPGVSHNTYPAIDRFRAAYPALAARVVRITADGESFEV